MSHPSPSDLGFHPKCLASTGAKYSRSIAETQATRDVRNRALGHGKESNFFREAQFSGDGTTIITHNEDQCLRTFVLPSELLEVEQDPYSLDPYSAFAVSSSIQSYAIYPGYQLQDPSTTLVLSANTGQPIRLSNALQLETAHAKYKLIKQTTEEYLRANSLTFTTDGNHFIAGSIGRISVFDTLMDGSGPISEHLTHKGKFTAGFTGPVPSMRSNGIVSALCLNHDRVLAVGTTEREIALYSHEGRGECTTNFSVRHLDDDVKKITGHGITKLAWSPCGTYLLVAERQSDGIHVYDVRNTFQRVAWLSGRQADTAQRLGIDVVRTASGYEVWGGGVDGRVRMWTNPGTVAGVQSPDGILEMHGDPVSSTVWHPQGAVLATCSGMRFVLDEIDSDSDQPASQNGLIREHGSTNEATVAIDNTLKVWAV